MSIFNQFKPENYTNESKIWRYIDFSKFVDLLDSRSLFFSQLNVLCKQDPYEGSYVPFASNKTDEDSKKILKELDKIIQNGTFVSCWYLSEIESAALWKLFPKSDEGIAIKTTVNKLNNAIEHKNTEKIILQGSVTYGHEKIIKSRKESFYSIEHAVFTKRAFFEHEKELRLVIHTYDLKTPVLYNGTGIKIEVDIASMISEVIISPTAPSWFGDLVRRVVKHYGFSFEMRV